ncbi:MAG: penicillin-binding transpeptidase domain-containing protein [Anaerolineae bacterium]|nr:penicillin-binding transpeptidase domain-containing protein [Anaerolineae bacterium]
MMYRRLFPLLSIVFLLIACSGPDAQDSAEALSQTPIVAPTSTQLPAPPGSETVGVTFLRAWEQGDYAMMYDQLSQRSRALVDFDTFVATYTDALEEARIVSMRAQPLAAEQSGNSAEIAFRTLLESSVVGTINRNNAMELGYENGRWGINWNEGLILPELSGGNRLSLEIYPVQRAGIYDKNDRLLATQQEAIRIEVIPEQLDDEAGFLAALSPILGQSEAAIRARYIDNPPNWRTTLGVVPKSVIETNFQTLSPYFGFGLEVPGGNGRTYLPETIVEESAESDQPAVEKTVGVAPHIVGYTGPIPSDAVDAYMLQGYQLDDRIGLTGIEAWAEDYLHGTSGGILRVLSPAGTNLGVIQEVEARPARNVHASFETEFQLAVQEALEQALATHPLAERGAIVVMDVNTGAVRAMATYPTYDPTLFNEIRPNSDELTTVLNDPTRPLLNRAAQGAYPPGSSFKIITMSSGLLHGLYTPDTRYTCSGSWTGLGPDLIKYDWLLSGHGNITLTQALTRSCNPFFYDVGFHLDEVDPDWLPSTAKAFGLGQPTGVQGIPEEPGLIPDPEWKLNNLGEGWSPGDAVNMAIGQGFVLATPLQMAMVTAAVANGGTIYQPTLIDRIDGTGGVPEEVIQPVVKGTLPLSAEHLAAVQTGMNDVTDGAFGTAQEAFRGFSVPTAGKTGTAQVPDPDGAPHAWFTSYAPTEATTTPDGRTVSGPEIAVTVLIENAGDGSAVAAPVTRRIYELFYGMDVTPFPWER